MQTHIFVSFEIGFIVQAVKRVKLMVKNGDEIDMNPSPEYRDTRSSTSTTTLFSQPDALKNLVVFVSFTEIFCLYLHFSMECPFDSTQIQCALLRAKGGRVTS